MTKGCTDTLFSFQIFLISRATFSYSVIFSTSVLGRLRVKGTAAVFVTIAVLLSVCLSMSIVSSLLQCTVLSIMMDLSRYKKHVNWFHHRFWLVSIYNAVFISGILHFKTVCLWIIFASSLYLPRHADSDSDEHPAIRGPIRTRNLLTKPSAWYILSYLNLSLIVIGWRPPLWSSG